MLTELRIENFAIIQQPGAAVCSPGWSPLPAKPARANRSSWTPSTALVGGKADATVIRSGAERALVEAIFRMPAESKPADLTKSSSAKTCWMTRTTLTLGARDPPRGAQHRRASTGARVKPEPAARAGQLPGGYPRPVRAPLAAATCASTWACSTATPASEARWTPTAPAYRQLLDAAPRAGRTAPGRAGCRPPHRHAHLTRSRRSKPASLEARRRRRAAPGARPPGQCRKPGRAGPGSPAAAGRGHARSALPSPT